MPKLTTTAALAAAAIAASITIPFGTPPALAEVVAGKRTQLAQSTLRQTRIPMVLVIGVMNSAFRGTQLRLHNFRARH